MSTEWEIGRLDLDAYLARVGYRGNREPTGPTLAALHRAHVAAIAFENLDVILGRGVSVDLDDVQAKLVGRDRGGYCYEHNVLFAAVLERLGYRVERFLARIGADHDRPRPRTHMTLHAHAADGGQSWLADVGFGGGLLDPLPWGDTGPHRQGGWTYQLIVQGGTWQVREQHNDGWATLYSFTEERQHLSDVVMSNHFTSTYPDSPFIAQIVVMGKAPEQHRRLIGRPLSITRPDGAVHERELSDPEIADTLRTEFGLQLDSDEMGRLVDSLPLISG